MTQLKARNRQGSGSRTALCALLAAVGAVPLCAMACAETPDNGFTSATSTGPGPGSGGSGGAGGTGSNTGGTLFDGGIGPLVVVSPANPIFKVEVPLTGQSIQFTCLNLATQEPVDGATWALSLPDYGTISQSGVFTPNGTRVGEVNVTCEAGESSASTKLTIFIHASDNAGGLTQQQMDILRGPPGGSDIGWQFMYPYDRTVFPRGILAPEIHLSQGTQPSNAYYVRIVAGDYEYEGFFSTAGTNTQLQMSQSAWEALTNSAGGTSVEVHVSKLYNGQKVGPIYRTWILAAGKLHGTVYYNSYDSALAGGNGAILRVKGSSPTPEVLSGNCTVCHSVAADGSTAAAYGGTYDLSNGMVNPPIVWNDSYAAVFSALFPKGGEVLVTHTQSNFVSTPGGGGTPLAELRTRNGTLIPNSGIESLHTMTPVFSPDGTRLAFLDGGQSNTTLSIMSYDELTQKFTDYDVLSTPASNHFHSWPAFTPDGKYVVFQDGTSSDLATWSNNGGKLFVVNTETKQIMYPLNLNGDGYMPAGPRDEELNYEPTIAPVASGGYFWVMFTSRRTYGNKLTGDASTTKRLWVSAFNVNAVDGEDATHPAFYLAGQELNAGNSRGFWALDACKQDGQGCDSGDECCNGFCNPTGDPPEFKCGPPDGECSDEFESCTTAADCCDPTLECIGGKCSQLPPN